MALAIPILETSARPQLRPECQPHLQGRLVPQQCWLPERPVVSHSVLGTAAVAAALGVNALAVARRRRRCRVNCISVSSVGGVQAGKARFVGGLSQCSRYPDKNLRGRPVSWPQKSQTTARSAIGSESVGDLDLVQTSLACSAAFGLNSGATVATLAAAIFCHETGHFMCARTVNLPAAEFSLGFGPELLSNAEASAAPLDDTCEFKDAEDDKVRLERYSGEIAVIVNGTVITRGVPTFDRSSATLDCEGQGTCQVPDEATDEVEAILQKAAEAAADEVANPPDTVFTLRLLPIGGYVRFDERKVVKLEDGTMASQLDALPILPQVWIYAGGVLTNMVVAFTTLCIGALTTGVPDRKPLPGIRVDNLGEDAVLRTGLKAKDVLLQIGDLDLHAPGQSVTATVDFIHKLPAKEPVSVLVERAGKEFRLDIVPLTDASTGFQRLGVSIVGNTERIFLKANDLLEAAGLATASIQSQLGEQLAALKGLLSFSGASGEIVGPVGILKQGSDLTEAEGLIGLAMFFVSVNLNLALLNALPVPALDGGKIAFTIAGKILGKPVDEKAKQDVESVFIGLVLLGIAGITLKDIGKLFLP